MTRGLVKLAVLATAAAVVYWMLARWAPAVALAAAVSAPSMPFECANCHRELVEGRRKRRHVPRLGGKRRVVCVECAAAIDGQGTLGVTVQQGRGRA